MVGVKKAHEGLRPLSFEDPVKASLHVAQEIATLIRSRNAEGKGTVLGLVTGSTPIPLYRELVRMHREEGLSFRRVITFNLDEYCSIGPTHPESYHRFMREKLFDHIDILDTNVHIPNGMQPRDEVVAACSKYEEAIAAAGGIDIQILGIGRTGHIGFNKPGSSLESETRLVALDDLTREDAAHRFRGKENVPCFAITMGIHSIMKARKVFLMAWGASKAEVVFQAINKSPSSAIPASFLRLHENVCVCLDRSSSSELYEEQVRSVPSAPFVPDGVSFEEATKRVTHMAIGAHQDDLEIFAYHGIEACYRKADQWFAGVTVTDGGGSSRTGPYRDFSDAQMKQFRHEEQNEAADVGEYSFQVQLGLPSGEVATPPPSSTLVDNLAELLDQCRPHTLYLHNPADKHDTHVATLARCIEAVRKLPVDARPQKIYGCEVWRDLDWLDDELKVALPVNANPELATTLIDVFASQIQGGKNYTLATLGRRHANATFFQSHSVDEASAYTFAIDLTPLANDDSLTLTEFTDGLLQSFQSDVIKRIRSHSL